MVIKDKTRVSDSFAAEPFQSAIVFAFFFVLVFAFDTDSGHDMLHPMLPHLLYAKLSRSNTRWLP